MTINPENDADFHGYVAGFTGSQTVADAEKSADAGYYTPISGDDLVRGKAGAAAHRERLLNSIFVPEHLKCATEGCDRTILGHNLGEYTAHGNLSMDQARAKRVFRGY